MEHLWEEAPFLLPWCLRVTFELEMDLQQGVAHLKADLFKTHEHQKTQGQSD